MPTSQVHLLTRSSSQRKSLMTFRLWLIFKERKIFIFIKVQNDQDGLCFWVDNELLVGQAAIHCHTKIYRIGTVLSDIRRKKDGQVFLDFILKREE